MAEECNSQPAAAPFRPLIAPPRTPDAGAEQPRFDYGAILEKVMKASAPYVGQGRVTDYLPALAKVNPRRFGLALATTDGEVHGVGDWEEPFAIQSISKVFALALLLAHDSGVIWQRVGREPSGNPFNSLVQLEYDRGIPRNPFINAGALVVTDRLISLLGEAYKASCDLCRRESGNPQVTSDPEMAASELQHGDRNAALGYFLASYGNLSNPVGAVLAEYSQQCSIMMSCGDLARAAGFLARHGIARDGSRLLSCSDAKRLNALMLTCGTYDGAGEFAFRAGLPVKSGIGGGILAVIPNRCTLCVWSPGLDAKGNSVAAGAALDSFTTTTGWSVF